MRNTWAHRLRDVGRYDEALTHLEDVLPRFREGGLAFESLIAENRLAQLFQQLGQPGRAAQLLASERGDLPPGAMMMRAIHRADVAHDLGRDAVAAMRDALAMIPDADDIYYRIGTLFASRIVPADEGEAMATSLAAWAAARERLGLALAAHVRAAACSLRLGAPSRAVPHVDAALHLVADRHPDSFYLPELWLVAGRTAAALGRDDLASARWLAGRRWIDEVARVPAAFRASFLQRNPVNRELIALTSSDPRHPE